MDTRQITYRLVYDAEGNFKHLIMAQGTNQIHMTLGQTVLDTQVSNKWAYIKAAIDKLADKVKTDTDNEIINNKGVK